MSWSADEHDLLYDIALNRIETEMYVMIYEDEKIECEKWRATITATLDRATIPGIIHVIPPCQHHPE